MPYISETELSNLYGIIDRLETTLDKALSAKSQRNELLEALECLLAMSEPLHTKTGVLGWSAIEQARTTVAKMKGETHERRDYKSKGFS